MISVSGIGPPYGGEQREFGHLDRGVVGVRAIAERAGHAAATGFDGFDFQFWNEPQRLFHRLERAKGLLVAMAVYHRFVGDRR